MKGKFVGYLLFVVGILLIGIGAYNLTLKDFDILSGSGNGKDKNKNPNGGEETTERNKDYDYNDTKGAVKKNCDDVICIDDVSIFTDHDEVNYFTATAKNVSGKDINDYYFTFHFDLGDKKIDETYLVDSLNTKDDYPIMIGHENDEFMNIKSYTISKATDEEITAFMATFD